MIVIESCKEYVRTCACGRVLQITAGPLLPIDWCKDYGWDMREHPRQGGAVTFVCFYCKEEHK